MKKVKLVLSALVLVLALSIAAFGLASCGDDKDDKESGGGGGGSQTAGVPTGTYTIKSTAFVAAVYSDGCPHDPYLDADTGTGQNTPSGGGRIDIAANNDISFYAIGSTILNFTAGSKYWGTSKAIKIVGQGDGYTVVNAGASSGGIIATPSSTFVLSGASLNVSCTFAYADNIITLTVKWALADNAQHYWTQTYSFEK